MTMQTRVLPSDFDPPYPGYIYAQAVKGKRRHIFKTRQVVTGPKEKLRGYPPVAVCGVQVARSAWLAYPICERCKAHAHGLLDGYK
jgi:hypothetical protein